MANLLIFFKNCRNDSTETFYNHFTLYGEPICAMTLISYGQNLRNTANIDQIRANCELFHFFKKSVDTNRTKFSTVILNHIEILSKTPYDSTGIFYSQFTLFGGHMCAMASRPYGWDLRNIAKIDQ